MHKVFSVIGIVSFFHLYVLSSHFHVKCGVRQAGILSPFLFNIYVDDLIDSLSISGFVCYVNNSFFRVYYVCGRLINFIVLALWSPACWIYALSILNCTVLCIMLKYVLHSVIGKQRPVNAQIFLEQQAIIWKDSF